MVGWVNFFSLKFCVGFNFVPLCHLSVFFFFNKTFRVEAKTQVGSEKPETHIQVTLFISKSREPDKIL